jgi:signal transduction histidine kinase
MTYFFAKSLPTVWINPKQTNQIAGTGILASILLFIIWHLSKSTPQGTATDATFTLVFAIALLCSSVWLFLQPEKLTMLVLTSHFFANLFVLSTICKSLFYPPANHIFATSFLSACTNYVLVLQLFTYATFQKGAKIFGWGQYACLAVLLVVHWLRDVGDSHPSTLVPRVILLLAPLISLILLSFLVRWRDDADRNEQAMQHEKEKFMAMMSHEIRGQLQTTMSASELLNTKVVDPIAQRALMRLTGVTLQLDRYLRDWMEFVRLENPELSIEKKAFNLMTLVDHVVEDYKTAAIDRGLVINGPLWSTLHPSTRLNWQTAQGDAFRIQQVLTNLIDNALKYTNQGTIQVSISAPSDRADWANLSVTDSGPGIAEEQLPLVFQPFLRLSSDNNSSIKGSGLGLAISWRLMQRMGGRLEASSQVGKGSTFTMSFPLQSR